MLRNDYFGLRYDDTYPAFVILPHPPQLIDTDGEGDRFVFHRGTNRLFEMGVLLAQMAADGYEPPPQEIGENPGWLRRNTQFYLPRDFQITPIPETSYSHRVDTAIDGVSATERLWIKPKFDEIDNVSMNNIAYSGGNRNFGFWLEIGDPVTTLRSGLNSYDVSNEPPATANEVNESVPRFIFETISNGNTNNPVRFAGRVIGGWRIDRRIAGDLNVALMVPGLAQEQQLVPAIPRTRVDTYLSDDRKTCIMWVSGGPVEPRGPGNILIDFYSIMAQGEIAFGADSLNLRFETTVASGATELQVRDALVTWLNGLTGALMGVGTAFTLHAATTTPTQPRLNLTITRTTGEAVAFDFAPFFNCH